MTNIDPILPTDPDDYIALTDKNGMNRSRESVMIDIWELTRGIEFCILEPDEDEYFHSLRALVEAIDWEELEVEENRFEFHILNSLHEIAIDTLDR